MPEDPRLFRDDISDPLIAILKKMMAKKPRDRYQSPEDLASDLRMLARIDNLSWGSDLAEFAIVNSQSRRSWFEALLPLVLCTALIAVVTLWLVNANQVDAVFPIPKVEIANVSIGSESASNSIKPQEVKSDTPSIADISKPDEQTQSSDENLSHLLVVENIDELTSLRSEIGEGKQKVYKSLDEALAEAASLTTACKIWIGQDSAIQKRWRPTGTDRTLLSQSNRFPENDSQSASMTQPFQAKQGSIRIALNSMPVS